MVSPSFAGQVTMAAYDFNGDGYDDIIRTDEDDEGTSIRVYARIEGSFFCKPVFVSVVPGRLMQVPEVIDVNKDGRKEYFFVTGEERGIIYYDYKDNEYKKTASFDF